MLIDVSVILVSSVISVDSVVLDVPVIPVVAVALVETFKILKKRKAAVYLLFYDGIPLSESKLPESRIEVFIDEELLSVANTIKKRIHDMQ